MDFTAHLQVKPWSCNFINFLKPHYSIRLSKLTCLMRELIAPLPLINHSADLDHTHKAASYLSVQLIVYCTLGRFKKNIQG